jgi:hypothetical protein
MDTDKSGALSVKEFHAGLRVMGIHLAPAMAKKVASRFDADGTGSIDYLEMFALLASHELPPRDRRQLRLEERRRIEAEREANGMKPLGLDVDLPSGEGSDSDGEHSNLSSTRKVAQGTRRVIRVKPETLASLGLSTHIQPRRSKSQTKGTAPPVEERLPALNGVVEASPVMALHDIKPSTGEAGKEVYLSDLFTQRFQKGRVKELVRFSVNDLKAMTQIELASLLVARDYTYEDIEPIFGNIQVLSFGASIVTDRLPRWRATACCMDRSYWRL